MFAERLKLLRVERNLTQHEVAKAVGISARVMGYYETDDRFPKSEDILIRITNYFDVSADWILGRSEIRPMTVQQEKLLIIDCSDFSDDEKSKILDYIELLRLSHK